MTTTDAERELLVPAKGKAEPLGDANGEFSAFNRIARPFGG